MGNKIDFGNRCPSANDFEMYLQNRSGSTFMKSFDLHIDECELCSEALVGFKEAEVKDVSGLLQKSTAKFYSSRDNNITKLYRTIGYAATIVVLLGISTVMYIVSNQKTDYYQTLGFDYSVLYEQQPLKNKTLSQKSNEQFVYISSCNKIAYNDQYMTIEMLNEALDTQKNATLIRVEVANDNYECANEIINLIKNRHSIPVLTIR